MPSLAKRPRGSRLQPWPCSISPKPPTPPRPGAPSSPPAMIPSASRSFSEPDPLRRHPPGGRQRGRARPAGRRPASEKHRHLGQAMSADLRIGGISPAGAKRPACRVSPARRKAVMTPTPFTCPIPPSSARWSGATWNLGTPTQGAGKKSFVSNPVSHRLTKIISIAPLINENDAGICGHFFSLVARQYGQHPPL